jgi:outer membrane protein OmpA-like peptidoglycan-associated protein/outer membrane protein assembly factor BamD (BamD/ComL family)
MKRKNILWLFIAFAFAHCSSAQPTTSEKYITRKTASERLKKTYKQGIKYSRAGENEKALKAFSKVLKKEPTFIDAQIQWAAIHYDMKNHEMAEQGFEKVIQIDSFYKKKVFYTLALTEMRMKKFDEAVLHFENYLAAQPNNKILEKKSKKHIINSQFMKMAYANPVPYEPKSLGGNINTRNPEYLPSLTADGKQLIYTARLYGQEDFMMSTKKDGVWQKGFPLDGINTEQNEGAQSISADGKFLVFTACNRKDGYGSCDLYYSEIRDNQWTPPANIGTPINSRGWESQPSLSADGRAIYFTSNRKGGQGGRDIWVSYRQKDGKWGTPQNVGDIINSPYNDQSPFIHADNQTLYFMSDGHPGMGGPDLFFSRKKNEKEWFTPKNLGYPINTEAAEGALVLSLDGKIGYFASDIKNVRKGESVFSSGTKGGHTDIYSFELYPEARPQPVTYVQAYVYDLETKKKLSAKVDFMDLNSGETYASSFTDQDGEFLICLPMGKNYALNISKEKYLFHSENFSLEKTQSLDNPFLLKIGLQPIKDKVVTATTESEIISPPVVLRNILFETGSAELKPESLFELNQLLQLLEKNSTLKIQINGHTDNVGSVENNLTLSTNRAKAVKDFLIKNEIAANRLNHKGYGETKSIDSNDTEWGRQNNRRTEFVMLK